MNRNGIAAVVLAIAGSAGVAVLTSTSPPAPVAAPRPADGIVFETTPADSNFAPLPTGEVFFTTTGGPR